MRTKPSQTPKTDSYGARPIGFYSCETVPAEFARKLERQNTELLEALQAFDAWLIAPGPLDTGTIVAMRQKARAAIARATGEAEP